MCTKFLNRENKMMTKTGNRSCHENMQMTVMRRREVARCSLACNKKPERLQYLKTIHKKLGATKSPYRGI